MPSPSLSPDFASVVAHAGIAPTLEPRERQLAIRRAIATRRGSGDGTVDHAGSVVILMSPDDQKFYSRTLEEAMVRCLVWLMAPELRIGPFVVRGSLAAYDGLGKVQLSSAGPAQAVNSPDSPAHPAH